MRSQCEPIFEKPLAEIFVWTCTVKSVNTARLQYGSAAATGVTQKTLLDEGADAFIRNSIYGKRRSLSWSRGQDQVGIPALVEHLKKSAVLGRKNARTA